MKYFNVGFGKKYIYIFNDRVQTHRKRVYSAFGPFFSPRILASLGKKKMNKAAL